MKRILFQGDSITDCGRAREGGYAHWLGNGYATMVSGELGLKYPGEYEFFNRGISGNRIVDLYARIKSDFINLKPDYASILIGVNDAWHEYSRQNGVDTEKFEKIYCLLLDEIFEALPNIKIFLMTPFLLHGTSADSCEEYPDRFERLQKDTMGKADAVKRIGKKYGLPVIDLQKAFDEHLSEKAPDSYWVTDGVHPHLAGHALIKELWIKQFNEII